MRQVLCDCPRERQAENTARRVDGHGLHRVDPLHAETRDRAAGNAQPFVRRLATVVDDQHIMGFRSYQWVVTGRVGPHNQFGKIPA